MPSWVTAVAVNVHRESPRQVEECLSRVARNLPDSKRMVFLNGEERPEIIRLAVEYGFAAEMGAANLGTNHTWHQWWLRMFRFFDRANVDYCFKFDPDTMVDRTPIQFPLADYFGQVQHSFYGFPFIQGGITGLSIRAVRAVLNDRLLDYGPDKKWFVLRLSPTAAFADDQLLALVMAHIGIHPVSWSECRSAWKEPVLNESLSFAVVHPRFY